MPGFPAWVLVAVPPFISILLARIVAYWSQAMVFAKGWTRHDIFRLAWWRTLSSTVPLLMLAIGIDAVFNMSPLGLLWMSCAGVTMLFATARLRRAEGINFRPVKSGELYKRSVVMSKRMGVRLRRVCVVPFGRGRLTNAYSGWGEIAITDDYGHWLHGSQLDFVIGHELAHAKQKHGLKALLTMTGVFAALAAVTFVIPPMAAGWRIVFNFCVLLLPVATFNALSRYFEYAADRASVALTGGAEVAIRTLITMYRHSEVPTENSGIEDLFSTHPGLWRRVNAIARGAQISAQEVSKLRRDFNQRRGARAVVTVEISPLHSLTLPNVNA